jgi:hypothetical protein
MTAKEFLMRANRIDTCINTKLDQVSSLRELACKATSTLSGTPPGGSRDAHRMEDIIAKMIDLENEINSDIDELVDVKKQVMAVIKRVPGAELRSLLEMKYLCNRTWEDIADALDYGLRQINRMHGCALERVEALLREKS